MENDQNDDENEVYKTGFFWNKWNRTSSGNKQNKDVVGIGRLIKRKRLRLSTKLKSEILLNSW